MNKAQATLDRIRPAVKAVEAPTEARISQTGQAIQELELSVVEQQKMLIALAERMAPALRLAEIEKTATDSGINKAFEVPLAARLQELTAQVRRNTESIADLLARCDI